jgi:hypothetical protein
VHAELGKKESIERPTAAACRRGDGGGDMTYVKRSLDEMAQRGEPIGSELLREKVLGELVTARPRRMRRYRPAWALAAGAIGTLVIVGLAGLIVLLTDQDREPAVQPSTPPPTEAAPAPIETDPVIGPISFAPIAAEWTLLPTAEVFSGGFLEAVTTGGPGLIAVGGICNQTTTVLDNMTDTNIEVPGCGGFDDGDWDAAVWVSADGIEWTRVYAGNTEPGHQNMLDIAATDAGYIAVGFDATLGGDPPWLPEWVDGDGAVWTSADGTMWERTAVGDPGVGGPGLQRMEAVTSGGPGLITVGSEDGAPAAWTSVDGTAWQRARISRSGIEDRAVMLDIVAGGPGYVAVGYAEFIVGDFDEGVDRRAAVWTSVDGTEWTRVPHDEAVFDEPASGIGDGIAGRGEFAMYTVAAVGDRLVAAGVTGVGSSQRALWISEDGISWDRMVRGEDDWGLAGKNDPLGAIVVDGGRFAVFGFSDVPVSFPNKIGRVGREVAVTDAVTFGDGIVAVGYRDEHGVGAVWIGTWEE